MSEGRIWHKGLIVLLVIMPAKVATMNPKTMVKIIPAMIGTMYWFFLVPPEATTVSGSTGVATPGTSAAGVPTVGALTAGSMPKRSLLTEAIATASERACRTSNCDSEVRTGMS